MTTRHKLELAGSTVALLVIGLLFGAWKQNHDAALKAQGATELREQADRQIEQVRQDTEKQLLTMTATIEALRQQLSRTPAVTAPQIIREQVPSLAQAQPTIIQVPAQPATPTSPAVPAQQLAELPLAQFEEAEKQFASCLLDKQQLGAQLSACQANAKADADAYQALEREAQAWKQASKGGSLVHRFVHDAKTAALGIGIGAAAGVIVERAVTK